MLITMTSLTILVCLLIISPCNTLKLSRLQTIKSHSIKNKTHQQSDSEVRSESSDSSFDPFHNGAVKINPQNEKSLLQLPPMANDSWNARISLLVASALYGSNFGCVKILDQNMESSFAAACRFSLAALVFFAISDQCSVFQKENFAHTGGLGSWRVLFYWLLRTGHFAVNIISIYDSIYM